MNKKFISFSGGVESRTMAILFGANSTLLFVDTGSEHEELYKSIDEFEIFIEKFHKGSCKLLKLKHPNGSLEEEIIRKKFMPSIWKRYCTYRHKVKVIDDFLKNEGDCELAIGLNVDEDRRTGNLEELKNVSYTYPLQFDAIGYIGGLDRDDCENLLLVHGVHPKFPPYMSRGGCKFCFFKSEKEYKAMYFLNRKEFDEVLLLEERLQDKRSKHYSIMSNQKSMKQLATECKSESDFLKTDFKDIYAETNKKTYCGLFCHR